MTLSFRFHLGSFCTKFFSHWPRQRRWPLALVLVALSLHFGSGRVSGSCFTPPPGIFSWFRGEDNATDSITTLTGTLQNGAGFASGKAGRSFDLNGTNQWVEVSAFPNNISTNDFTVELWFYMRSLAGEQVLVEKYIETLNSARSGWSLTKLNDNTFRFVQSGSNPDFNFGSIASPNSWNHIAVTRTNGVLSAYVNGVFVASLTNLADLSSTTTLKFGHRGNPSDTPGSNDTRDFYLNGLLDEASFYSVALSPAEIAAIYNAGSAGKCDIDTTFCIPSPDGLINWWPGEGDGKNIAGTNAAVLQGGATFAPGKVGQAFTFDGVSSSVDLGNWFNLQTFSIGMWVKPGASQVSFADIMDNNHTNFRSWVFQYDNIFDAAGLHFHWGAANIGSINFTLTPDVWQYLVLTLDTNRVAKLYLDGGLVGTANGTGPIVYDGTEFLRLGTWGGGARNFNGQIDEVDIYNRALTGIEVTQLHMADTAGKCPPITIVMVSDSNTVAAATSSGLDTGDTTGLSFQPASVGAFGTFTPVPTGSPTNTVVINIPPGNGQSGFFKVLFGLPPSYANVRLAGSANVDDYGRVFLNGNPISPPLGSGIDQFGNKQVFTANAAYFQPGLNEILVSDSNGSGPSGAAFYFTVTFDLGTTSTCIPPASDLSAWWTGDGVTEDVVNGHNGTLTNGASYDVGLVGSAFSFNGGSSVVEVPDDPAWAFGTNEFSIDLWAKFNSTGWRTFMGSDNGSGTQDKWVFWLYNGILTFHLNGSSGYQDIGSYPFNPTLGQWYHLAVTRSADTYTFYVNGDPVSTNFNASVVPDAIVPLTIGGAEGIGFDGALDEVQIFNRALGSGEIRDIYDAGAAGQCKPLMNFPPMIAITSPTNGVSLPALANFTVAATASDSDGFVTQVEFFDGDGNLLATKTAPPYQLTLTNVPGGDYEFYARATDDSGNTSDSALVTVYVTSECVLPPSGGITWWQGEYNTRDFFGNFDGVLMNGAFFDLGKVNAGFSLNGTNAYVSIPTSAALNATSSFTWETWIKACDLNNSPVIMSKEISISDRVGLQITPSGCLAGYLDSGSYNVVSPGNVIRPNEFAHVAYVFDDAADQVRLYVNGFLVASAAETRTPTGAAGADLEIGRSQIAGAYFKGIIDEVSVFNRALSGSEIKSIYTAGSLGKCATSIKLADAQIFGGAGNQEGTAIRLFNGAAYMAGIDIRTNGAEGLVGRFSITSTNMALVWATNWPGQIGNDRFYDLTVISNAIFAAGDSFGRTTDNLGLKDTKGILTRFPLAGPIGVNGSVWDKQVPANGAFSFGGAEQINGVATSIEGTNTYIYATGFGQNSATNSRFFLAKVRSDGTNIWSVTDVDPNTSNEKFSSAGRAITVYKGAVYVAGDRDGDAVLSKFDLNGRLIWSSKAVAGRFNALTVYGGAIYTVGQADNGRDVNFLLAKWDEFGQLLWLNDYDQSDGGEDVLNGVVGLGSRIYAVGSTMTSESGRGSIILEIDSRNGQTLSTDSYDGLGDDVASGVATDGSDLFVIGKTRSLFGNANEIMLLRYKASQPLVPLQITTTNLPYGEVNRPYNALLTASGGKPPYSWSVVSNALPPGLSLAGDGTLFGAPTNAGTYDFTVQVADNSTPIQRVNQDLSIRVVISNALPSISITNPVTGSTFTAPAFLTLEATANDSDGSVARVDFYMNGFLIRNLVAIENPSLRSQSGKGPVNSGAPVGTSSSFTQAVNNLGPGTYEFTAVAYDDLGASNISSTVTIRVDEPGVTVIDFEALDARSSAVTGPALSNYLAGFGITLTNESAGTIVAVKNQTNINAGLSARASSGVNLITQSGSGAVSYTIGFSNSIPSFGFTRVQLLAGLRGVSHPEWQATAYDSSGVELGTIGEDQITSYTNVPAQFFHLEGPNIAWVRIEADDLHFTEFHSPLLDDFMIGTSSGNIAPSVTITNRLDGASFIAPADVSVTASATDTDGSVAEIRFYLGNYLVDDVSTTDNATITLEHLGPGTYTVRAVAVDDQGAVRSSTPVTFTVNPGPGVKVINFDALNATTRNVGGVALSNYLASFGVTITSATRGSRLEAADANNLFGGRTVVAPSPRNVFSQFGVDGPVSFTLRFDTPQQGVRFTRPELRAGLNGATHPRWFARAFDASGTEVASVGESLIRSYSTVEAEVFELTALNIVSVRFDSDSAGEAAFSAVLIDDLILDSNPVFNPLQVNVTSPTNGSVFIGPLDILLAADATNSAGSIESVEFYAGPVFIGSTTNAPYTFLWQEVLPGTYTIRARVLDANGAARISAPVNITVTPGLAADSTIINFDSLDASSGGVTGSALANYLAGFGITITNVTPGTQLEAESEQNLYFGEAIEAPSYPNVFTQTGLGSTMGFTLEFSNVLQGFTFSRAKLSAGDFGISHPAWRAIAFNTYGVPVAEVHEDFIFTYRDVDAKEFALVGTNIARVRFDSDNRNAAAFDAALLDDFILTTSSSNVPPVVTIEQPESGALYLAPANIPVTAQAADPDGSVLSVSFYVARPHRSAIFIGSTTSTNDVFSTTWTNASVGRYWLYALACDNSGAFTWSEPVFVGVQPQPDTFGIVDQPEDIDVAAGDTASFSVSTTDLGQPISFQWYFTDLNSFTNVLSGARSATLSVSNATTANVGYYYVVATSGGASVTSDPAYLNVVDEPIITSQPEGQTVVAGANVTFSVTATGAAPLSYQWLLNGNRIDGATTSMLTLTGVGPSDSGDYSVQVQNAAGAVESDSANLVVVLGNGAQASADNFADRISISPLFGPTFGSTCNATRETSEPRHAGKVGGKSIWYSWTATFTGVISFTTRGSSFDTLLAVYTGSDLTNLTFVASDDDTAGHLNSRVTFNCVEGIEYQIAVDGYNGACGTVVLSLPAGGYRVRDVANNEALPEITVQPVSQSVAAGAAVTLSVTAESALPLTYQWFYNDTPLIGATNSSFSITSVDSSYVGSYFVLVANDYGSANSDIANIQIVSGDVSNPGSVAAQDKFGQSLGSGVFTNSFASGKIPAGSVGTSRGYTTTQVFNTSSNTKEEDEPNICGEPGGKSQWFTYQAPTNGTLQVNTDGSGFNTVLGVYSGSGIDFSSLVLLGCDNRSSGNGGDRVKINATMGTTYFIAVDGVGGAGGTVQLNINLGDGPAITVQPQSKAAGIGSNATFNVTATGSIDLNFQWQFNGASISGATNSAFTRSNIQSNHLGSYRVVISNLVNVVTSSVASLSIATAPSIVSQPTNLTVTAGGNATFSVTAAGSAPLKYQWRFNGADISGATKSTLTLVNVQATNAGTYSVFVTNSIGSILSSNATLAILGVCTYSIAPASTAAGGSGTNGSIAVTTDASCAWTAVTTNSWITITAGDSGTGNGTVDYTVAANTNALARTGTITVAGKTFTITQSGVAVAASLNGKTITCVITNGTGAFSSSGSFLFITAATNNTYRIIPLSGTTDTNSGTFTYTLLNTETGEIVTSDGVTVDLAFTSATAGSYISTNLSGDTQSGTFTMLPTDVDLNSDGRVDIIFQNATGQQAAWFMQNTNFVGVALLRGGLAAGPGWTLKAATDFNGDGQTDLLWQHTNNKLAMWLMSGTNVTSSHLLRGGLAIGAGWKAVAAPDLDADGHPDILFQHDAGQLAVWYMNGTTFLRPASLRGGKSAGAGWKVFGARDFDGDGLADILFQNATSGQIAVWYMNGPNFSTVGLLRGGVSPGASWHASAITDLNSDGRYDVLFQHDNGKIAVWFMDRNTFLSPGLLRGGTAAGPGWRLAAPR